MTAPQLSRQIICAASIYGMSRYLSCTAPQANNPLKRKKEKKTPCVNSDSMKEANYYKYDVYRRRGLGGGRGGDPGHVSQIHHR